MHKDRITGGFINGWEDTFKDLIACSNQLERVAGNVRTLWQYYDGEGCETEIMSHTVYALRVALTSLDKIVDDAWKTHKAVQEGHDLRTLIREEAKATQPEPVAS